MASIINSTTTAGVTVTGDNSGSLQLATNNGTTAVTIDTSQNVGIGTSTPSSYAFGLAIDNTNATNTGYVFNLLSSGASWFKVGRLSASSTAIIQSGQDLSLQPDSGNVGIGTSSPAGKLHVMKTATGGSPQNPAGNQIVMENGESSGSADLQFLSANNGYNHIFFGDAADANVGTFLYDHNDNSMQFITNASERMRINAGGDVFMGTTTSFPGDGNTATGFMYQASAGKIFSSCSGGNTAFNFNLNGTGTIGHFCSSGTRVGNIGVTGSATSYNSGSDYRLKNNIQPLTNALQKVALLKPSKWIWKADETYGDGFVAHELAEVCPHAVTGEKDAVDKEGKPIHQSIDTSFLVATLTAAIQELKAELDATKAEVQALKGTL